MRGKAIRNSIFSQIFFVLFRSGQPLRRAVGGANFRASRERNCRKRRPGLHFRRILGIMSVSGTGVAENQPDEKERSGGTCAGIFARLPLSDGEHHANLLFRHRKCRRRVDRRGAAGRGRWRGHRILYEKLPAGAAHCAAKARRHLVEAQLCRVLRRSERAGFPACDRARLPRGRRAGRRVRHPHP